LVESWPQQTLNKQSAKAQKRIANGQQIQPLFTESAHSDAPNAPSYSAVAKGTAHPKIELQRDPSSSATTTDPPILLEFRNVPIPSRPGVINLITGAISQSRVFNRFSLFLNFLMIFACLDMQFSPLFFNQEKDISFVRVGGVGDTWVNIVARIPPAQVSNNLVDPLTMTSSMEQVSGAKLIYRLTQPLGPWQQGPEFTCTNETDFMSTVHLTDLYPSTQYEYRLALPGPSSLSFHPSFEKAQRFNTWSDPLLSATTGTHYKFASTSCMIPAWPWEPLKWGKNRLRMKGVEYLGNAINEKGVSFLACSPLKL